MNRLSAWLPVAAAVLWGACEGGGVAGLEESLAGRRVCFQTKPGEFEQFFQFDESGKVTFGMIDKSGKALRPPGKAASYEVKELIVTIREGEAIRLVLTFSQPALEKGATFTVKDMDGSVETRTISLVAPVSPVGIIKPLGN